jgi:hypothetical protein
MREGELSSGRELCHVVLISKFARQFHPRARRVEGSLSLPSRGSSTLSSTSDADGIPRRKVEIGSLGNIFHLIRDLISSAEWSANK